MIRPPVFLLAFFRMTFDGERERPAFASRGPAALFLSVAALVYSQSALGAYVRHLEAGLACPDFPTCLGTWFPPLFAETVLAHFSHRTLGDLVLLTAGMVSLFVRRDPRQRGNSPLALALLVLVAAQVGGGALGGLSGAPYLAPAPPPAAAPGGVP